MPTETPFFSLFLFTDQKCARNLEKTLNLIEACKKLGQKFFCFNERFPFKTDDFELWSVIY